ncbi:MAG: DUF2007 domain-containing protein [Bacteroidetes bacterium]|nr:DUF2007 domain-containing protein [Bacteroidota bacterium]
MPHEFVKLYRGTPISVMTLVDALELEGIVPIVKNPSESARLAGFGILSSEQSVWVHQDEREKALKVFNNLQL